MVVVTWDYVQRTNVVYYLWNKIIERVKPINNPRLLYNSIVKSFEGLFLEMKTM